VRSSRWAALDELVAPPAFDRFKRLFGEPPNSSGRHGDQPIVTKPEVRFRLELIPIDRNALTIRFCCSSQSRHSAVGHSQSAVRPIAPFSRWSP